MIFIEAPSIFSDTPQIAHSDDVFVGVFYYASGQKTRFNTPCFRIINACRH